MRLKDCIQNTSNFNKSSTAKHPCDMGGVHRYKRLKYSGLYVVKGCGSGVRTRNIVKRKAQFVLDLVGYRTQGDGRPGD